MDTSTARVALAALALLAPVLVGCGGDDGTDGSGGGGGGGGGVPEVKTAALGTPVDIEFRASGADTVQGTGTVTVTAVREGAIKDLTDAGFELDPEEAATTPFYVDVAFQNNADVEVDIQGMSGRDQDNTLILPLILLDLSGEGFAPCPKVPRKVAAGQSATGCSIILVPEGSTLEKVSYNAGGAAGFLYWESGL